MTADESTCHLLELNLLGPLYSALIGLGEINSSLAQNSSNNETESYTRDLFAFFRAHHIAMQVLLCIGIITNSLSAIVWRKEMKTKSGAFFLCCLTASDAVFCVAVILMCLNIVNDTGGCYAMIVDKSVLLLGGISRSLTVVVVAQRCIALWKPVSMAQLCTLRRQVVVLVCIFIVLLGLILFGVYVTVVFCRFCGTSFYLPRENAIYWMKADNVVTFIYHMLILISLIVFSTRLLISVFTLHEKKSTAIPSGWVKDLELRMTVITLCVAGISLLEFLFAFYDTFKYLGSMEISEGRFTSVLAFRWMYITNSTINFIIFVCIGKNFRSQLCSLCCKKEEEDKTTSRSQETGI